MLVPCWLVCAARLTKERATALFLGKTRLDCRSYPREGRVPTRPTRPSVEVLTGAMGGCWNVPSPGRRTTRSTRCDRPGGGRQHDSRTEAWTGPQVAWRWPAEPGRIRRKKINSLATGFRFLGSCSDRGLSARLLRTSLLALLSFSVSLWYSTTDCLRACRSSIHRFCTCSAAAWIGVRGRPFARPPALEAGGAARGSGSISLPHRLNIEDSNVIDVGYAG